MALASILVGLHFRAGALALPAEGRPLESVARAGAKISVLIDGGQWWRLVVAPLHHLEPGHLATNMALIAAMAFMAVRLMGHGATWAIFLSGAWLSTAISARYSPALWSLGASGGGYALTGALLGVLVAGPWRVPGRWRLWAVLGLLALQIASGGPAADKVAHGSGALWGLLCGLWAGARLRQLSTALPGPRAVWAAVAVAALGLVGVAEVEAGGAADATTPQAVGAACVWSPPAGFVTAPSPLDGEPDAVPVDCLTNALSTVCVAPVREQAATPPVLRRWLGSPTRAVENLPSGYTGEAAISPDAPVAQREILWNPTAHLAVLATFVPERSGAPRRADALDGLLSGLHCGVR